MTASVGKNCDSGRNTEEGGDEHGKFRVAGLSHFH